MTRTKNLNACDSVLQTLQITSKSHLAVSTLFHYAVFIKYVPLEVGGDLTINLTAPLFFDFFVRISEKI